MIRALLCHSNCQTPEECAQIMQDFFRQRREKQKADKLATKSLVDQS